MMLLSQTSTLVALALGWLTLCTKAVTPVQYISAVNVTQPINLAVSPVCGALNSTTFTEVNAGVKLSATKTIVAFGDSWTSNGSNGTISLAPVIFPPNPSAGSRVGGKGRASNGFVWVEDMGNTLGAKVVNYAWGGAVTDNQAWNSTKAAPRVDFVQETSLFTQTGRILSDLTPANTLYTIQFGNDNGQFQLDGGDWNKASDTFLAQLAILQAHGAKNFLIHWVYFAEPNTDAFQSRIFAGLQQARAKNGINFATTCLVSANTMVGGCNDPDHAVFWIPGHPSAVTHELINQYTLQTLSQFLLLPP
ncbi:hypothetical protein BD410DRAFT_512527 [Rickenella mellea]|uniref:Carbohydrate esterase family 16 protein n=1 Tax=Rickenella mellea TaxID=50990 RepID=A0A4Y7PRG6_9AGAM|nr:hypothetical protein BD410DRAFT_512527 [Rickenella mellea]